MAIVFQYGSNMSAKRFNSPDRLAGDAKLIGVASTVERYELAFTVWSRTNNCAAADLIPSDTGRSIHGVLYDVPDWLLSRDTSKARRSLDAIEGEGKNYKREDIEVVRHNGDKCMALTYVVTYRKTSLMTSLAYVRHILSGLNEHDLAEDYFQYVLSRVIENNCELLPSLPQWDRLSDWCSEVG